MKAPQKYKGKKLVYEETFKSPFGKETREEALKVLQSIREVHDSAHGWLELAGHAEKHADGKWYAVRHHAQYK